MSFCSSYSQSEYFEVKISLEKQVLSVVSGDIINLNWPLWCGPIVFSSEQRQKHLQAYFWIILLRAHEHTWTPNS